MASNGRQWGSYVEPLEVEAGGLDNSSGDPYADTGTVPLVNHGQHRHSGLVSRIELWAGLLVLVGILSFTVGRISAPEYIEISNCQNGGSSGYADTVSPEGPVSSNLEARFDYRGRPRAITATNGAVAADHGRCSDIGVSFLKQGGNAVDAAIATALCQGILNPMASGIGGGHFMLVRKSNGEAEVIDAREVAPLGATENMFVGKPEAAITGGLAAAVPLELKGLYLAHERHGKLDWERLLQPAIELAEKGFEAHPYLVSAISNPGNLEFIKDNRALSKVFLIEKAGVLRPPQVNETCCARPQLAAFLKDVASSGPDVLYTGKYAQPFITEIQSAGGIISLQDLSSAHAEIKSPLKAHAMGVDLLLPPPPSSAATVFTALAVLAGYDLPLAGAGSLGFHRLVESMKHSFALRMSLGDPGPGAGAGEEFVDVGLILEDMLSLDYAESLRLMLNDDGILNETLYGGKWNVVSSGVHKDDHGTSHLSVVDSDRMAVSMTTTINTAFGSKVVSQSTGILLNNQMDDFSTPGQANIYGIAPSASNFIRPGKKPFSSMCPIIVEHDGDLRLVIGASGGPRIISAVIQTLLRLLSYGEDVFSAVAGPRLHHQLIPPALFVEDWSAGGVGFTFDSSMAAELKERGHNLTATNWGAVVQAIAVEIESTGRLMAVSDPRKDGAPSAE